jgi:hypothetical protein
MGVKQPSSPDSDLRELLVSLLLFVQALHLGDDHCGADHVSMGRPAGSDSECCALPADYCMHEPIGLAFRLEPADTWAPGGSIRHHGSLMPLARIGPTGTLPTDSRVVSGPYTRATTRAWWGRAQGPFGPCAADPRGKRPGESAWPKFGLAASPLQSRLPRPGPQ